MLAATLIHPWNEALMDEDGVIGADDWPELERRVDDALALATTQLQPAYPNRSSTGIS